MKTGTGTLLIWNDITPGAEAAFRGWHDEEHIPERVGLPGFTHGRRLFNPAAVPRWLTLYEAESESVFSSPPYLARLDSPTPGTIANLPNFRATQRMAGQVVAAAGEERGGAIGTTRIWMSEAALASGDVGALELLVAAVIAHSGIVAAAAIVSDAAGTGRATTERSLRTPDETPPDIVLLVEGQSAMVLPDLTAEAAAVLPGAEKIAGDSYTVEFALAAETRKA